MDFDPSSRIEFLKIEKKRFVQQSRVFYALQMMRKATCMREIRLGSDN